MLGRCALLLALAILPRVGAAASVAYTDQASFLGGLPGAPTTLDFEAQTPGTTIPNGGSLGGISFFYSLGGELLLVTDSFDATSGENSLGLTGGDDALLDGDALSFLFSPPVLAFGLFVITSDAAVADEIQLATSEGTVLGSGVPDVGFAPPDGELPDGGIVYFLGLVSDAPFASAALVFGDTDVNFAYNADDLVTFVPEPGTLMLVGLGLAGLALGRYRRSRGA